MAIQTVAVDERQKARAPQITRGELPMPMLAAGDRLTRTEFERRYSAMPHVKKAELIEGVVYMPSPVSAQHSRPHADILTWLGRFRTSTPGVDLHDNVTVRLDMDNEVQPDALLRLEPEAGGRSRINAEQYVEGAPELIVEIAASSASYDLHDKLKVYRRNGVQEYLVWQIFDQRIDWFELVEGEYIPLKPDQEGVICSRVFPGLRLAVTPLLAAPADLAAVLAELQKGLQTAEHTAFAERLARSGR
jgi:Uma2 family endonuclease